MPSFQDKKANLLNAKARKKTEFYRTTNAIDEKMYDLILDLVRYGALPDRKQNARIKKRLDVLMAQKAKIEEKILHIDILMFEMAKIELQGHV